MDTEYILKNQTEKLLFCFSSPPSNTATSGGKILPHLQDIWIYYASNGGKKEVFR